MYHALYDVTRRSVCVFINFAQQTLFVQVLKNPLQKENKGFFFFSWLVINKFIFCANGNKQKLWLKIGPPHLSQLQKKFMCCVWKCRGTPYSLGYDVLHSEKYSTELTTSNFHSFRSLQHLLHHKVLEQEG